MPAQDIVSFGRLREHEGTTANDVVLVPTDPSQARQISRWHFELRRFADGYHLRTVSDGPIPVRARVTAFLASVTGGLGLAVAFLI